MKKLLFVAIIFSAAISCDQKTTDPCAAFDAADSEMLNLIEQIRNAHSDDKKFLRNFNMEQVYWIQYRDHHIRSIYPQDWDRHYRKKFGQEVFNPCKCKEMARFTKNRIKELQLWIAGGPNDQDDCPSLWKKKGL